MVTQVLEGAGEGEGMQEHEGPDLREALLSRYSHFQAEQLCALKKEVIQHVLKHTEEKGGERIT